MSKLWNLGGQTKRKERKDGGGSNQQSISAMEAVLEEQAHVISSLCADIDTPPLPTLPLTVYQAPRKTIQPPSGFNQYQWLVDEMEAIQMSDMFGLRGAWNIGNNVYGNGSGNCYTDKVYVNGSGNR